MQNPYRGNINQLAGFFKKKKHWANGSFSEEDLLRPRCSGSVVWHKQSQNNLCFLLMGCFKLKWFEETKKKSFHFKCPNDFTSVDFSIQGVFVVELPIRSARVVLRVVCLHRLGPQITMERGSSPVMGRSSYYCCVCHYSHWLWSVWMRSFRQPTLVSLSYFHWGLSTGKGSLSELWWTQTLWWTIFCTWISLNYKCIHLFFWALLVWGGGAEALYFSDDILNNLWWQKVELTQNYAPVNATNLAGK